MLQPLPPPKNLNSPLAQMRGNHVGMRVADLEAARRWYVEKLDFRASAEGSAGEIRFVYLYPPADDAFRIELVGGASPASKPVPHNLPASMVATGYHHFCLDVEDLDAVVVELRRREVEVLAGPFFNESVGQNIAFITDPWGNVIEIAQKIG